MFLAYSRKHRRQSWSPYLRMIPWLLPHTRLWEGCEGNVRRVSRLRFARCVRARSQTSGRKTLGRPKRREFSSGWWRREEGPEKVEATPNHATTTSSAAPKVLPRRSSRKSSSAAAACARARTSKGPSTKPPPKTRRGVGGHLPRMRSETVLPRVRVPHVLVSHGYALLDVWHEADPGAYAREAICARSAKHSSVNTPPALAAAGGGGKPKGGGQFWGASRNPSVIARTRCDVF